VTDASIPSHIHTLHYTTESLPFVAIALMERAVQNVTLVHISTIRKVWPMPA
jgi:hypothetical protein